MKRLIPLALSLSVLALTSACGGSSSGGGGEGDLEGLTGTIGSKDFSEQYILAHITGELLNANGADVDVNTQLVGSANVRQALEGGDFLGYWEYTGTSWISYNNQTKPITDPEEQFQAVKEADAENDIAWLDPAPFNNTYAFAIRQDKAEELGVSTLSDVAALAADEQTFCIESEFSTRDDGWPGLKGAYGFDVSDDDLVMLDTGVIYTATQEGTDCNFGEVFATDGRIQAMDLLVMEDDQKFFPVYQGAFTLDAAALEEYPEIADVMAEVSPLLTTEVMQELNAKADVDGEDPEDIAIDWLVEQGLIDE
ncbi:glycine/betaine ABC transporter substrate-binding protein [Nocardioides szechwanensis]|uniref:Osmoprotectant transport system substrate-binding protein n=1 Tax=Nocardioides szechwanensis TaxID=1005944 RepID=A0A1H0H0H4_9ACTN|nr:glycine betaine ABC transporter substrate-binding protein [Nocardioides szechwanensis]GEP34126.1 glycine/betaine ABC transporter substrate-binding protein [Nocardioides szechwanensis]SDO12431.1 osmoprotectant transport system substrate-binding protein [Nocardioides szechwanensis]